MRISCSLPQFLDTCASVGLDVVENVVHIPTDMATELTMRAEESLDGVEIHYTPNTYIINVLTLVQQRLGIPATFLPVASRTSPLHTSTDGHYDQTYLTTYPHLMFTLIPWLNRTVPQEHVDDVYASCTPTSRHAIMLLARLVGYGHRLGSLGRLFDIVSHGTTHQLTRIIMHLVSDHDLSDDDMLRWSEWSEGHMLKDILFHKRLAPLPIEVCGGIYRNGPEMKTQPPPPTEYILFRGLKTSVRGDPRLVRRRVEDVLRACGIDFLRHDDWYVAAPTLNIFFTQHIMGRVIVTVEPQYDDEVTLTRVWKLLRRNTL